MPPATLYLLSFREANTALPRVLRYLTTQLSPAPLVIARPIRWIIRPEHFTVSKLLHPQASHYHLLVVVLGVSTSAPLSSELSSLILDRFSLSFGVPSRVLTSDWESKNRSLLHPRKQDVPPLTKALENDPQISQSAQGLELTEELQRFASKWDQDGQKKGAVSMLNLLAFHQGEAAHKEYTEYGKAFAESIGSKRGGVAKLVGKTLPSSEGTKSEWEEIALAHYPSIWHFCDMLASKDYQLVNQRHRVKSLQDTCILMTSEIEIEEMLRQQQSSKL